MKKLLVFVLFLSGTAWAGRMDEIFLMTEESMLAVLQLKFHSNQYEIISQDFTQAKPNRDLAIKTRIIMTDSHLATNQEWTCVTQFVKTPKFFKVSETECY